MAKKKAELDRALANAERVRQERDTLAEMVATRNDSEARLRDLVDSLQVCSSLFETLLVCHLCAVYTSGRSGSLTGCNIFHAKI